VEKKKTTDQNDQLSIYNTYGQIY